MIETTDKMKRVQITLVIGLCILVCLYILRLGRPTLSPAFGDDNAVYLVSALSLAQGSGYRLINFPEDPVSSMYPIGYPGVLSLVMKIFGMTSIGLEIARLLNVAFCLGGLIFVFYMLKRQVKSELAVILTIEIGRAHV